MYQVIEMYGDNEPWWFFEDWKEDIENQAEFENLDEATSFFGKRAHELYKNYPKYKLHTSYLVAFWKVGDLRWCEECDDDLQQFKGLLLLKDGKQIEKPADEISQYQNQKGQRCPIWKDRVEQ